MSDEKTKKIDEVSGDLWNSVKGREYSLKIKQEKTTLATIKLKGGENLIGRMPENDIMVDDPEVSRSHARVVFLEDKDAIFIEDLESENGTFVNGEKVDKKALKIGDTIELGAHTLQLQYADEYSMKPELPEQIEKASQQDWRLEQTMAAVTPEQQRMIAEKLSKPKKDLYGTMAVQSEEEQKKIMERLSTKTTSETTAPGKKKSSKFFMTLGEGDKKFTTPVEFDYMREIDPVREKNLEDAIYINMKIGNVIFGKKIKF